MKFHSWLGGVTLKSKNEITKKSEIESLVPKKEMVYSLIPYMGKKPQAVVKVGDYVKLGQQIAVCRDGTMGVYSSVSGKIKAIEKRLCSDNLYYNSIVIENDEKFDETEFDEVVELEQLDEEQLLNLFGAYGIRDYRLDNIPLYEKLIQANSKNVRYVIINCMECESYLSGIYRRIMDDPDLFIEGAKVFNHLYPKAKCVFAIGNKKMDAVINMEKSTRSDAYINVIAIPEKYPGGETMQLIYQVTGNIYENERIAIADGVICVNAETLCAVRNAVYDGVVPMSRVITVSGNACENPGNYEVLLGTRIDDIIEQVGEKEEAYMVVAGGPMTGNLIEERDVPVTEAIEAVLLLTKDEAPIYQPSDCIKCGNCVNVCPKRLVPQKLFSYAKDDNKEAFLKWHGDLCSACGCCSYVCPANIPITAYIEKMNKEMSGRGEKQNGYRE